MTRSLLCHVSGKVQGVGFRSFIRNLAVSLGLRGYARNLWDGRVETLVQGEDTELAEFQARLVQGSPYSRVTDMDCRDLDNEALHADFRIRF